MSNIKWFGPAFAGVLLALAMGGPALGGKGKGKPGGGGGGGGGGETALYAITDLGGFTGGNGVQSWAFGINNPNSVGLVQIVGDSYIAAGSPRPHHPIVWDVNDAGDLFGHADLGLLPGAERGTALMINDDGLVAGNLYPERAWIVSPGGNMTALPTFGGSTHPLGMNNVGDIVGVAREPDDGESHNVLWHVDLQGNVTGPIDLGAFHAWDINDNGIMVGVDEDNLTASIAWFDNQMVLQRQSIGLLNSGDTVSLGVAINNNGEVAGWSGPHGFFWSVDGGMVPLGDFGGATSEPRTLNNQGQVVGWATDRKGDRQAFLWENGTLTNLNDATSSDAQWYLSVAEGINDAGQIVGEGRIGGRRNSELHGFLLTRNPSP